MGVGHRRRIPDLVIACGCQRKRRDAHEGTVAVRALPIATTTLLDCRGGRVSHVKGGAVDRVRALVEPAGEFVPHVIHVNVMKGTVAGAGRKHERGVI